MHTCVKNREGERKDRKERERRGREGGGRRGRERQQCLEKPEEGMVSLELEFLELPKSCQSVLGTELRSPRRKSKYL